MLGPGKGSALALLLQDATLARAMKSYIVPLPGATVIVTVAWLVPPGPTAVMTYVVVAAGVTI